MADIAIQELMESLKDLDQRDLFKKAFDYVKSKTNKEKVTIGEIIHYFNEAEKEDDYKFTLGFTALAMLTDKKEAMNVSERDLKLITDKIIEDMC